MKIICSKRDDIMKQRDEFDARRESLRKSRELDTSNARRATQRVFREVEDVVRKQLSSVSKLPLDVSANYGRLHGDDSGIEVRVECGGPFTDGNALSWKYSVWLGKDGEVERESGSWSGLNATTKEEMDSLRRSVRALEILNEDIDWKELLRTELPDWESFMRSDYAELYQERPNFEQQLRELDIEEAIENGTPLHGVAVEETAYRSGIPGTYKILRETPKCYFVEFSPDGYNGYATDAVKVSKSKLINALDQ